ncbi:MAG: alpha-glucosidase [Calditrichaeota bacterium]|nr:alpha-glucosidase [Calditrichota bacterium]
MSFERPRVVLIGAGSAQFGYDTMGDLAQSDIFRSRSPHLVLHDINPVALERVAKALAAFIDREKLPFTISATTDRKEALQGADFCIISIEVGNRFELWEQDWRIPQQYGIRQVYGENGGPGGFFHSLRIIPPILEICGDIERLCPAAYVFNYSNPMSRICTTVHLKYPNLKFIGLCHEIGSLKQHLPKMLEMPLERIHFTAGGLNHYSVLLRAVDRETGRDLYPEILEKSPGYFENQESWLPDMLREEFQHRRPQKWHERGLFKLLLEKYSLLPITTDSHLGEYPGWAYDIVDHQGIMDFYMTYKKYILRADPRIEMKLSERVVPIMEGILEDLNYEEAAVNLPNRGMIPDLPDYLAVEVPGTVNATGVHGIAIGDLMPPGFAALLMNQAAIHKMTAETILNQSRELALQALLADPIVDKVGAVEKMLDHMLEVQGAYLGYLR